MLLARIAGKPLPDVLADRVFAPAGMVDTAFHVPADKLHRFVPQLAPGEDGFAVFDPVDGMWASAPQFPLSSAGLVSTIDDLVAFTDRLRDGGLISTTSLSAMTTDHLTPQQRRCRAVPRRRRLGLRAVRRTRRPLRLGRRTGDRVAGRSAHRCR